MDDLKAFRRRARLTQKELAERVGVSDMTVRRWESGTIQPRRAHIPQLAVALGLDAEQLPAMLRASTEEKRRRARAAVRV